VDPFIGTGGHGHTYPGAAFPFGMVQLSPDTRTDSWDGCSGYHYSDSTLMGFSHTHLSGTGVGDYGDILLVPRRRIPFDPDTIDSIPGIPPARFQHGRESASPGYYRVFLEEDSIEVELTVTERAGFHRYTPSGKGRLWVIVDLNHGVVTEEVNAFRIRKVGRQEIAGYRHSRGWAKDQRIYFWARFSLPFERIWMADSSGSRHGEARMGDGRAFLEYRLDPGECLLVKVGISAVSEEGARNNLENGIPGWDFERVREETRQVWNRILGKIRITGGDDSGKRIFYTALYHAMLVPNLFTDADGRYRGMDGAIYHAEGYRQYTVFSLWDTFRAAHPLFLLLEPRRSIDFIQSLMSHFRQGGELPMWELAGNDTRCMIGYHAVSVIADAFAKGVRDIDGEEALDAMLHSARLDGQGKKAYRERGYIPAEAASASVSRTLEYAYDDWCIAQMARIQNRPSVFQEFIQRAQYYKNILDPSTGLMRPRVNGDWLKPFDPNEVSFHYTEANAWQYGFFVPQDVEGWMDIAGGEDRLKRLLDSLFTADSRTSGFQQADITGLIGQYAHGNEPSHHIAYLYAYAGVPWKTQERVHQIASSLYHDRPDGLCGNEDCGQMSAWYLFSAMGFYPVCPGSDQYVIGRPLFPGIEMDVGDGKVFRIQAEHLSKRNRYIQSAALDGKLWPRSYLRHKDILNGGELVFEMGPEPNVSWGSAPGNRPYSRIHREELVTVPSIRGDRTFTSSVEVTMQSLYPRGRIRYTVDGSEPGPGSPQYISPLRLNRSSTVRAAVFLSDGRRSLTETARFTRIPRGRTILLMNRYSPKYTGGGYNALIDFQRGQSDFRLGAWQGYEQDDLRAVVDLGSVQRVKRVTLGCLQDIGSWIFFPVRVRVGLSADGIHFSAEKTLESALILRTEGTLLRDFVLTFDSADARYVRVHAENVGICPAWHRGAGGKAWLFADEIVIE
jgi:predicted alpha-1,2-mannosidase